MKGKNILKFLKCVCKVLSKLLILVYNLKITTICRNFSFDKVYAFFAVHFFNWNNGCVKFGTFRRSVPIPLDKFHVNVHVLGQCQEAQIGRTSEIWCVTEAHMGQEHSFAPTGWHIPLTSQTLPCLEVLEVLEMLARDASMVHLSSPHMGPGQCHQPEVRLLQILYNKSCCWRCYILSYAFGDSPVF